MKGSRDEITCSLFGINWQIWDLKPGKLTPSLRHPSQNSDTLSQRVSELPQIKPVTHCVLKTNRENIMEQYFLCILFPLYHLKSLDFINYVDIQINLKGARYTSAFI